MVKFIENLFGSGKKPKSEAEEYEELDLSEFEEGFKDEPASMFVRVAELSGLDIMPELKKCGYTNRGWSQCIIYR